MEMFFFSFQFHSHFFLFHSSNAKKKLDSLDGMEWVVWLYQMVFRDSFWLSAQESFLAVKAGLPQTLLPRVGPHLELRSLVILNICILSSRSKVLGQSRYFFYSMISAAKETRPIKVLSKQNFRKIVSFFPNIIPILLGRSYG